MAIQEAVKVNGTPEQVYELLTDGALFSKLTGGAPTRLESEEGTAFELFGGMIRGRQLELVPGERVVQSWRPKTWDPGVHSIVRFDLLAESGVTLVTLTHDAYPSALEDHLVEGWRENYLKPMVEFFG